MAFKWVVIVVMSNVVVEEALQFVKGTMVFERVCMTWSVGGAVVSGARG
jgi:hypothetical protein